MDEKEEKLQKQFDAEDELVKRFAVRLQRIYDNRTAGDYTFEAVLSVFLSEYVQLEQNRSDRSE